jgi:hypothetical protein
VEAGAVEGDLMAAGGEGDGGDGVDVGGLADVERVGEVGVVVAVGGLDDDDVVAIGGEVEVEKGIPNEAFFGVGEFATVGVGEDESGVETVALAGGAEIEEPVGVFGGVETEEVEIAVGIEAAEYGGGRGDGLRFLGEGVGFGFGEMGEIANAEEEGRGGAAGGDDVEGVEAKRGIGWDLYLDG